MGKIPRFVLAISRYGASDKGGVSALSAQLHCALVRGWGEKSTARMGVHVGEWRFLLTFVINTRGLPQCGPSPNRTRSIMSQSNERELQLLRKHFLSLVSEESPIISRPLTDLFLLADCATGTLHLYDDEDKEISHVSVFAWAETGTESEPSEVAIETLRELVTRLEQKGFWDRPCFARPFSIELIRPDFSVIEDLLFLDEDLIKIEPPLLDGVGEELDRFLDELLEDLK